MAQLSSSKAKAFALAITGATALTFPSHVAAQQLANATPSVTAIEQAGQVAADICARRGDKTVDCLRLESNRIVAQVRAQANQVGAQANNEGTCADQIKVGITEGRFTREALGAVLAGRPAREVGACNILNVLTKS